MKTLKSIDGKSMLIGCLLATTIFFATGATGITDKWSEQQQWEIGKITKGTEPAYLLWRDIIVPLKGSSQSTRIKETTTKYHEWPRGWEPIRISDKDPRTIIVRRRIK